MRVNRRGFLLVAFVATCVGLVIQGRQPLLEAVGKREAPDGPNEAYQWRRLAWLDENGQIAPDAFQRAYEQRDANRAYWEAHGGTDSAVWVERGPNNVMGRTRALLIHPTNPNLMFAGTVSGGIWKSTDAGATWNPVDDRLKSLGISCMAMDPQNPNVMYAGTAEGWLAGDTVVGAGAYKSVDGGTSWSLLPNSSSWNNFYRIAVCPSNSNLILAGTQYGILRSTDGGNSWTIRYFSNIGYQVVWHPTDQNKAIASVTEWNATDLRWVSRAMYSNDAGASWSAAASGLGALSTPSGIQRIELAYAASSPNIVYAIWNANIWKSTDGGVNYTMQAGTIASGYGSYCRSLWVDPTNPNFIIAGGNYLSRSVDGGAHAQQISTTSVQPGQPHPDSHYIVQHPDYDGISNKSIYVTTDGGVFKANDITSAGISWVNLDQQNRSTQFYGADGDGASGRIVGGTQDNGHLTLNNGSNNAVFTFGGDGGFAAIDWTNPLYGYGEYQNGAIHRSSDGGASVAYIYYGIGGTALFITPFILDPNNPNTMLVGTTFLWRTTDVRAANVQWVSIRPISTYCISAVAAAPGNSNIIWVGQVDGSIQKTTNGTAATPTWTDVDNNGATNPLPNRYITRIVVDPANSNVVYVALGGFSWDNLWKTTDGGANWTAITGSGVTALPSAPIRGFARHPSRPDWLFAGTEVGFFQSIDGGANWSTTDFGPANVAVYELVFMHNSFTLLAATHGRGLWTASLPAPDAYVTSFSMARGSVISGTTADIGASDDAYLQMQPGPIVTTSDFPIQFIADGTSPFQTPGTLQFTAEAAATAGGIRQTIELYDFQAGAYEQLDNRIIQTTDSTVTVNATNPVRFVQSGTKLVRARLRWKNTTPVVVWPWKSRLDLAKWSIWP